MRSEIDRGQSRIPMNSTYPATSSISAKNTLAADITLLVSCTPGLTELALAKSLFGRMGYQQRVNSTCRHLFREGRVERRGTGGPSHPFTYYPGQINRRGQTLVLGS
jgi:hypothetical protein